MTENAEKITEKCAFFAGKIKEILTKRKRFPIIICIDGRSASGKTTLAAALYEHFDGNCLVIHADDFFLPKSRKTSGRLMQKGGNLDYERLGLLLENLKKGGEGAILFEKYDCAAEKYLPITAERRELVIVEGVYAAGEHLRSFYDEVFILDVDKATQHRRLAARESAQMLLRYEREFLPLEENYFA